MPCDDFNRELPSPYYPALCLPRRLLSASICQAQQKGLRNKPESYCCGVQFTATVIFTCPDTSPFPQKSPGRQLTHHRAQSKGDKLVIVFSHFSVRNVNCGDYVFLAKSLRYIVSTKDTWPRQMRSSVPPRIKGIQSGAVRTCPPNRGIPFLAR